MSSTTATVHSGSSDVKRVYVWQWPIRIYHLATVLSVVVLFGSGWLISHPISSPEASSAGAEASSFFAMGKMRQAHLIAAMIFGVAFVWRVIWFFLGNSYARSGFPALWKPSWWRELCGQALEYLKLESGRPQLGHNALAGLSYVIFIAGLGLVQVFTGFALYGQSAPGGLIDRLFGWVLPLLGGAMRTTSWHHLAAWGFIVFIILHVYIVLIDARAYRNGLVASMITGYKSSATPEGEDHD